MKVIICIICLFLAGCITSSTGNLNSAPGPTIKVLSINLCEQWHTPRQGRADKIIEFVKDRQVDIILTQEGMKGVGQFDAVEYIAAKLGYSYSQAPTFGVPGFFEYCVGVISRYPITNSKPAGCQVEGGDPIDNVYFPGSSRGLLVSTGGIHVMSCHLTVPTELDQKIKQIQCLTSALPAGPIIWGGDFNLTRDNPAYPYIKFQEATYSGIPQVDMIFFRGLSLLESKQVFEDGYVSDHNGIFATFGR